MKDEYDFSDAVGNTYIENGASLLEKNWNRLSPEEKKKALYLKQKRLLDLFLERNAISKAQYEKSLHDMTEKMGMQDVEE